MRFAVASLAIPALAIGVVAQRPPPSDAPAAGVLRGRVIDARDGAALPRTRIIIVAGEQEPAFVLTDDRGAFGLVVPPARAYQGRATKAGYAAAAFTVPAAQMEQDVLLRLWPGAAIVGRVVERTGDPAAGIAVGARLEGDASGLPPFVGQSDDFGEFRLGGLPPGRYLVQMLRVPYSTEALDAQPAPVRLKTLDAIARAFESRPESPGTAATVDVRAGEEVAGPVLIADAIPGGARCAQPRGAAPATAVDSGTVRGRVTGPSGEPVACAHVWLARAGAPARAAATDASGQYLIDGVPPGDYGLEARAAGYATRWFGQRHPGEPGTALRVRARAAVDAVDIVLSKGGVIEGNVVDERGEPIAGALVRAFEVRRVDGRLVAVPARGMGDAPDRWRGPGWSGERVRATDDRGRYRLYGLPPGTYLIGASLEGAVGGGTLASAYAPVFHPGTTDSTGAARIEVGFGAEPLRADIVFVAAPTATLTGRLVDSLGQPGTGVVQLRPSTRSGRLDTLARTAAASPDGTFTFTGVPRGEYVVYAAGREVGMQYVHVDDLTPAPLVLRTAPGATIEGRLTIEGPVEPGTRVVLRALPADWDRAIGPGTFTALPGGGFRLTGLHGPRRFDCCQGFDAWYLKSAMVNGEDVTDRAFDTGSGGGRYQGDLVVSTRGAAVSGTVTTDEGILGTFTVVVFPLDRGGWGPGSRYVKVVQADRSGAFRVSGLPPGEYLVSALATLHHTGAPAWPAPDVLAALAGRAEPLVLAEGEHATTALRVSGR